MIKSLHRPLTILCHGSLLFLLGCAVPASSVQLTPTPAAAQIIPAPEKEEEEYGFICPMHTDHTSDVEGKCPRCGMTLVRAALFEMRDYKLDFVASPAAPRPGEPVTLTFAVAHPATGEATRGFELVHDKPYHLFVISQDMTFFEHIHPQQADDGSWFIQTVLPTPGYYSVLSDFTPTGGSSQFLTRMIMTAGYQGDLLSNSARLVPDTVRTQTVDGLTATLSLDPEAPRAGTYTHLTYRVSHDGKPVNDLQPYLGAFGHMLIMSEDMVDYVHSHPVEMPSHDVDIETLRSGPDVIFEGLMPKSGHFRAWAQFKYQDKVYTFANTFEVFEVGAQTSR